MKSNNQEEINSKIIKGLEKAYLKLIEFKRQKQSPLVILKDDKVIKVKP